MASRLVALASVVLCACGDNLVAERPVIRPPLPTAPSTRPFCSGQAQVYGYGDQVIEYTYDTAGFVTRLRTWADEVVEYSYDDNHFVRHFTYHVPAQSSPTVIDAYDYEETFTRDADGRVVSYVERQGDRTETLTYDYDSAGRLIRIGGIDNGVVEYAYTGDELNPRTGRQTRASADGDFVLAFASSPDQRQLHADLSFSDGRLYTSYDMSFDDARRVTDVLVVYYPESVVNFRHHTEYGADGTVAVDNMAYSDGADAAAYAVQFDRNGIWTATTLTSPDLSESESTYLEEPTTRGCALSRAPRSPWPLRPLPPRGAGRALPRMPGIATLCRHTVSVGC